MPRFLPPKNNPETNFSKLNKGSNKNLKNSNRDGENSLGKAQLKGFGPEPFKGLLNTTKRDRTEDGPLKGAEIGLEDATDGVESENGEGKAGVGHGDVKGKADLRITGKRGIGIGLREFGRMVLRVGAGFSNRTGSEHVLPWRARGIGIGIGIGRWVRVRNELHWWKGQRNGLW